MDAENFAPPPGFEPLTVQPVPSRYTDWAIPAHVMSPVLLIEVISYILFSGADVYK
jgi:hypothetical protein